MFSGHENRVYLSPGTRAAGYLYLPSPCVRQPVGGSIGRSVAWATSKGGPCVFAPFNEKLVFAPKNQKTPSCTSSTSPPPTPSGLPDEAEEVHGAMEVVLLPLGRRLPDALREQIARRHAQEQGEKAVKSFYQYAAVRYHNIL